MEEHNVDLWLCSLSSVSEAQVTQCEALLNEVELSRRSRIKSPQKARDYVIAHGYLRWLLSRYRSEISPQNWIFSKTENGKPFVEGYPLYFNLSHCREMVAVAITSSAEVGIDIEKIGERHNIDGIAQRYFSKEEQNHLNEMDILERRQFFYAYWTLKEAYSKGTGLGLANILSEFSANLRESEVIQSNASDDWCFINGRLSENFSLSATVLAGQIPAKFKLFRAEPFDEAKEVSNQLISPRFSS